MDSRELARTLLDAAWISARFATAFAALLAVASMVAVAARGSRPGNGAPRVRRPGAGPRMAVQLAALILGAAVTAWTLGPGLVPGAVVGERATRW